jgi:hypothetical protein
MEWHVPQNVTYQAAPSPNGGIPLPAVAWVDERQGLASYGSLATSDGYGSSFSHGSAGWPAQAVQGSGPSYQSSGVPAHLVVSSESHTSQQPRTAPGAATYVQPQVYGDPGGARAGSLSAMPPSAAAWPATKLQSFAQAAPAALAGPSVPMPMGGSAEQMLAFGVAASPPAGYVHTRSQSFTGMGPSSLFPPAKVEAGPSATAGPRRSMSRSQGSGAPAAVPASLRRPSRSRGTSRPSLAQEDGEDLDEDDDDDDSSVS